MNKKVGIVTIYGHNYGACLQAYAVQTMVKKFDNECAIINYSPIRIKISILLKLYKKVKKLLSQPIDTFNSRITNIKYKTMYQKRADRFDYFISQYLNIDEYKIETLEDASTISSIYDVYTTGSDQVWNPTHFKADPIYLLDFVDDNKIRLAFAPSIARQTIPNIYKDEFRRMLSKFDFLSVREDINVDTITDLLPEKEVFHMLDPTLLLSACDWDELAGERIVETPYIFVYLFGDLDYIKQFTDYVQKITGLRIVSFPFNMRELKNSDITLIFDAGPCEFVNLIKNASMIITDSFHATAFSINYNKDFYTLLRQEDSNPDNMNARFTSILLLLQLEDRLILPTQDWKQKAISSIDYSIPNNLLKVQREKSMQYLESGLK